MERHRICIVSSKALCDGPRVEKEALALAGAGYDVHAILCQSLSWMEPWDAQLAAEGSIDYQALAIHRRDALTRIRHRSATVLQRSMTLLSAALGAPPGIAELACSDRIPGLLRRGLTRKADLYIAHNLPALPVAAMLAAVHCAPLAFDAEDDHVGELPDDAPRRKRAIVESIQSRYLPRCAYVAAPSDAIADLLQRTYGIARPTVVHNVFPWSARAQLDGQRRDRRSAPFSLYWFSQTIGLDRGLQDVIRAAGLLRGDFELHLRGTASSTVRAALIDLAREHGVAERLIFHDQVHPDELLSRAAEHDVGLALEQPARRNYRLTVTNKLFFYLVAGLAVAATATEGQARILREQPHAGMCYEPGDHVTLARGLQRWIDDPQLLRRARAAALEAARTRFCWEIEREKLITSVRGVLAARRDAE